MVTNGSWTNYESYSRANKNETENGIKPELFTGNGKDYVDVYMDDKFTVTSFFLVPDNIPSVDGMRTANISIIFQANLDKLYTTAPHRFDAEMHNQIENILTGLDGRFSFIDTHISLDDVYAGLDTEQVRLNDTHPCHVVRFEIEANYIPECNPTFASTGATCDISVVVATENESVLGADDGEATATPTDGQGSLTYAWTGPNGFTSTSQNLTGLAAGTYTVIVTDSIITSPACTATDNGTVLAGADANQILFINPNDATTINTPNPPLPSVSDPVSFAKDLSPAGNDLSNVSAPTQVIWETTHFNHSASSKLLGSSSVDFDITTDFSIGVWFNLSDMTSNRGIIGKWSSTSGDRSYVLTALSNGDVMFFVRDSVGGTISVTSGLSISTGNLYFAFAVYDSVAEEIKISATLSTAGAAETFVTAPNANGINSGNAIFTIGDNGQGGLIGDTYIAYAYKNAQTQAQIDSLFQIGATV